MNMKEYARVYGNVKGYDEICKNMEEYARVCWEYV